MHDQDNEADRLSVRRSILVWLGAIMLGWGIAFGLIFAYWAISRQDPVRNQDIQIVETQTIGKMMPAAGDPAPIADH